MLSCYELEEEAAMPRQGQSAKQGRKKNYLRLHLHGSGAKKRVQVHIMPSTQVQQATQRSGRTSGEHEKSQDILRGLVLLLWDDKSEN